MSQLINNYIIGCKPVTDIQLLESKWRELESRSDANFFLSWVWIGSWLRIYQPDVDLLQITSDGDIVALGLIVRTKGTRYKILSSNIIRLHQTGDPEKDLITLEYNGFITDSCHHEAATKACIDYLIEHYPLWDEMIVGAITSAELSLFAAAGLYCHELEEAPSYGVDLVSMRQSGKAYLDTLSRNTRYQIRRSIRLYSEITETRLETAQDIETALLFLDGAAQLHMQRWGSNEGESGFSNPEFKAFHRELIRKGWLTGNIELSRLLVGLEPIAYLYNFIYRNRVYFYLSAIVFHENSKLKPGLVSHSLCIQKHLEEGLDYYDFMKGEARYKENLGERQQKLFTVALQKGLFKFKLEQFARRVKQIIVDHELN